MNVAAKGLLVGVVMLIFQRDSYAWGFDIGGEHIAMTWAAVRTLGPAVLAVLGAQAVKLFRVYCGYPDFNWARYGTLIGDKFKWSDTRSGKRVPDKRRDWNASKYCLYDEATGWGAFADHGPPGSLVAAKKLLGIALREFRAGRIVEGARYAGAALHYTQDSASPPHAADVKGPGELHGIMESVKRKDLIRIDGYAPMPLGRTDDEILAAFEHGLKGQVEAAAQAARRIQALVEAEKPDEAELVVAEVACSLARFTADVITTLARAAPANCRAENIESARGVNLLKNGDFEEASAGDGQPDAWVRDWHDLNDTQAVLEYLSDAGRRGSCCVSVARSPAASAEWRTRWADAVFVAPGQSFHCSGWLRAPSATGRSCLRVCLSDREMNPVAVHRSKAPARCSDWQRLSVEFSVPPQVIEVRVGCFSADNQGMSFFDDIELVRL